MKCGKCSGSGIESYFDHGSVQFGQQAVEPIRCAKCDGIGHLRTFDLDQISEAAMFAEVSESQKESLLAYLLKG